MAPLQNSTSESEFYAWTAASSAACPKLLEVWEQKKNGGASPMACRGESEKIVDCYNRTIAAMPDSPCGDAMETYKACLDTNYKSFTHTACYDARESVFKCVAQNIGPFDE
eukprot:CAMPEP_0168754162 /NCGR_PEP_ID=MMETSP0724-20121128/19352_1 /TAXON_ID=265536 /ORGANISM="Amphiprora sp., Strain CCMP467" /LENGTH=110 /DNA_ID=CAMNT_0008802619 /DNA_START=86 /DNA_END=421 /DNA_ORIENTATION=+